MKTLLAAAVLLAAASAHASTTTFSLQGTNPDGRSTYSGTVTTTDVGKGANGEQAATVVWRVGNSAPVRGVAMTTPDSPKRISVSFPNSPIPGVALGDLLGDGRVSLQWFVGGQRAGREIWTPRR